MSQAQYNLATKTDYLHRKMFLDPAGPVTIQRFEEVKYNKLVKFEQEARGFFWIPEEVSLTKDANDFKEASDTVKHIFTSTCCVKQPWTVCKDVVLHRCLLLWWAFLNWRH
jgi:ribonucleotide reductase beta subunit family protein with ferritin-like domain